MIDLEAVVSGYGESWYLTSTDSGCFSKCQQPFGATCQQRVPVNLFGVKTPLRTTWFKLTVLMKHRLGFETRLTRPCLLRVRDLEAMHANSEANAYPSTPDP